MRRSSDENRTRVAAHIGGGGNVGWCVPDGLVVIDADDEVAVRYFEEQLAEFPAQRTGRGMHYLGRLPEGVVFGNWTRLSTDEGGVFDIKVSGGQIVVEPSVHPTGREYKWIRRPVVDPPLIPSAVLALITSQKYSAARITGPYTEGARHSGLIKRAVALRKSGLGGNELKLALFEVNQIECDPPLDGLKEIEEIVKWVEQEVQPFEDTDAGNADRFAATMDQRAFNCPNLGWFIWNGYRWERDTSRKVLQLAVEVARSIGSTKWSKQSLSTPKLKAMLELAAPLLTKSADLLDADPDLLGAPTVTINLRTGVPRTPDPNDLITRSIAVDPDPEAQASRFVRFISETFPDPDVAAFVQRLFGYALTGSTSEQAIFFFIGEGANGKTTLVEAIKNVMGGYAQTLRSAALLASREGDLKGDDIFRLRGSRLVSAAEPEERGALAEAKVKELTGGDMQAARPLYGDFVEFRPTFKFVLSANQFPRITGGGFAIWRRIHIVPFDRTVPPSKYDLRLHETLQGEAAGILNWMLEGLREWRKRGLDPPRGVRNAADKHRYEADVVGRFVQEECEIGSAKTCVAGDLETAWREWSVRVGAEMSWTRASAALRNRFPVARKKSGRRRYEGIALRDGEGGEVF